MKYHDTAPSEPGLYLLDDNETLWFSGSAWTESDGSGIYDPVSYLPMLGPLPSDSDAMLSLACEVAFARMWLAWAGAIRDNERSYIKCADRFERGERSLSLCRDMERVTRELTSPPSR